MRHLIGKRARLQLLCLHSFFFFFFSLIFSLFPLNVHMMQCVLIVEITNCIWNIKLNSIQVKIPSDKFLYTANVIYGYGMEWDGMRWEEEEEKTVEINLMGHRWIWDKSMIMVIEARKLVRLKITRSSNRWPNCIFSLFW